MQHVPPTRESRPVINARGDPLVLVRVEYFSAPGDPLILAPVEFLSVRPLPVDPLLDLVLVELVDLADALRVNSACLNFPSVGLCSKYPRGGGNSS